MNDLEERISTEVYNAMNRMSHGSARSEQSREVRFGPSDVGWCSTKMLRQLRGEVEPEMPMVKAFLGTAVGDHVEQAIYSVNPTVTTQASVTVSFNSRDGQTYTLPGHPDLIDGKMVLDVKTVDGLDVVRRTGASMAQRFQRSLYGLGAWQCGVVTGDLEDILVGNVWVDRSGAEPKPHVQIEPFDMEVVYDAGDWLDTVLYAYKHNEDAPKEPPRNVCMVACGFAPVCREYDTDVEGIIRDEDTLTAIEVYTEGQRLENEGKRMKEAAKVALEGVAGFTSTHVVRTVHVNESIVPEFVRKGYDRVEVRKRSKAHFKENPDE